jgi:superfamily I DNA/RNA helicase
MIAAAKQCLAPRKVVFTPAQSQDLQDFASSVVCFFGPAGNGKTQRIIALVTHVLAQHAIAPDSVLCIYATPTKKMAEEFEYHLVEAMGSSEGIVPLGVDATGSTDRFEEHIREEARNLLKNERACVSAVDFTLNLLQRYRGETWTVENANFIEKAMCYLLAMRHEFLGQVYY